HEVGRAAAVTCAADDPRRAVDGGYRGGGGCRDRERDAARSAAQVEHAASGLDLRRLDEDRHPEAEVVDREARVEVVDVEAVGAKAATVEHAGSIVSSVLEEPQRLDLSLE